MVRLNWLQRFYWERIAKPASDRELYRHLIATPISSVMELGIGRGERMRRIARLVHFPEGCTQLRYIGLDRFESATDQSQHLTLKQAHQQAMQLGFKATLIPGEINSSIARAAQKVGSCDLIIADGAMDPHCIQASPIGQWIHHITHGSSAIFACSQPGTSLKRVVLTESKIKAAA